LALAVCVSLTFRARFGTGSSISIRNSGQVFSGTWNNTPVALKVLVMEGGISPSPMVRYTFRLIIIEILMSHLQAIRREIEVRHCCLESCHHLKSGDADMVDVEAYTHST
jgi:hypothetical protein